MEKLLLFPTWPRNYSVTSLNTLQCINHITDLLGNKKKQTQRIDQFKKDGQRKMNVPAYYSPAHPHKNFFMITEKKKKLFSRKTIVPLGENVLFL